MCNRAEFGGNNSLDTVIMRIDFLSMLPENMEKIVETISQKLGDQYKYSKVDNYNINLDISDPKKLITQDFIEQKVDLKNNFEFKNETNKVRYVVNQNFFLYERKNFENYEGSENDTNIFIDLFGEITKYKPQIQRLGIRKINVFYTKNKIIYLKRIVKDKFLSEIEKEIKPRYKTIYTPLYNNEKDGYNLGMQLDYGVLEKNENKNDVYRYMLDIDSYIRDIEKLNDLQKVKNEITNLKDQNFKIYIKQLQEKFKNTMLINDSKDKFDNEIRAFGIIHGVNYGRKV